MMRHFSDRFEHDVETVFRHLVLLEAARAWMPSHLRNDGKIIFENHKPVRYESNVCRGSEWVKFLYDITEYRYAEEVRILERGVSYYGGEFVEQGFDLPYSVYGQRLLFQRADGGSKVTYEVYLKPKTVADWLSCYYDFFKNVKKNTLAMNASLKEYLGEGRAQ